MNFRKFLVLQKKIFNRFNLTKVFIIFLLGFISRIFVNQYFGVNVFVDYTNYISMIYYLVMSFFVVLVHEFVGYFESFGIIPSSLITLFNNIPKVNLNAFFARKFSTIRKLVSSILSLFSERDNNVNKVCLSDKNCKESSMQVSTRNDNVKSSSFQVSSRGNHSDKNIGSHKHHGSNNQVGNSRGTQSNVGNSGNSHSSRVYNHGGAVGQPSMQPRGNNYFPERNDHRLRHYNRIDNIRDISRSQQGNNQSLNNRTNNQVPVMPQTERKGLNINEINNSGQNQDWQGNTNNPTRSAHLSGNERGGRENTNNPLVGGVDGGYIRECESKNFFNKFKVKSKRRFYWVVCGEFKGDFASYKEFKESWDPNTKVFKEIRKNVNTEIQDRVHNLKLVKRTLNWFFNLRK